MRKYLASLMIMAAVSSGAGAAKAANVENLEQQINDVADKTSSTLNQARQLIKVATTTAGVAVDAYNKTEKAVSSTVEVIRRGTAVYENIKPLISKAGDAWNWATNNNEYWRVVMVVGGLILVWIIIRFSI